MIYALVALLAFLAGAAFSAWLLLIVSLLNQQPKRRPVPPAQPEGGRR